MRIYSLILLLALASCVPPFHSSHRLSRIEAAVIAAVADTLIRPDDHRPYLLRKSAMAKFLSKQDMVLVEDALRSVRDSLWLADPEEVPLCSVSQCGVLRADRLSFGNGRLFAYVVQSSFKRCGYMDYEVEVLTTGGTARVTRVEVVETGDCGIRGKPPQQ